MKKIGLISDTHGYLDPLVEKYFKDCDEIWHAGDIGSLEVTDALKKMAFLRAVHGNIDNDIIRREFPEQRRFVLEGVDVWLIHIGGKPYVYDYRIRPRMNVNPPTLFICGHSHICLVQMDKRLKTLYMNPGAAGNHGFHKIKTLLRFNLNNGKIENLEVIELGARGSAKSTDSLD